MFEGATALVVDDSHSTATVISQILRHELKFGNVLHANDGKQALELFAKHPVDWIFSDIEMAEMNGLVLLSRIREQSRGKNLPFLVMSVHTAKDVIAKAIGAGATDFIAKPFNTASIVEKVRRIGQKAVELRTSPRHRRRHARVALARPLPCRVRFAADVEYIAEVVNLSLSGCLLRTPPFNQGGTIYDPATLELADAGNSLALKASVRRMEADGRDNRRLLVLTGVQFIGLDSSALESIKALITRHVAQKRAAPGDHPA